MEDTSSRDDSSSRMKKASNSNENNEDHVDPMNNMKRDARDKESASHSIENSANDHASNSAYGANAGSSSPREQLSSRNARSANNMANDANNGPSKNHAADNAEIVQHMMDKEAEEKSSANDESTGNSEDDHVENSPAAPSESSPLSNQGVAHREVHDMAETQKGASLHDRTPKTHASTRAKSSSEVSRRAHHAHSKVAKPRSHRRPVKLLQRHASTRTSKPRKGKGKPEKDFKESEEKAPAGPFSRSLLDEWGPQSEGMDAAITESGFKKVAKLKNEEEMKVYIRRVASSCSMKVIDEGGLNGIAAWYSGEESDEPGSLDKLKESLFSALLAASKDHWVSVKNTTKVTGSTAPLDLIGYVQVRSLRKAKEMVKFVTRMVESMGIKIIDKGGFEGLMHYYSEPDNSESFQRLLSEIKKAAYLHTWAELE